MAAKLTKTMIWLTRFFQWVFAVIIMAITAHFIRQFHNFGYHAPRETIVPLIFSVLAILFTTFSIVALYFLSHTMQLVSTVLDFILWVGYLASAGLLRRNYHVRGRNNSLWQKLYYMRTSSGRNGHYFRNDSLVRLLAALVVIQLILFFITMLLQLLVAKKYRDEQQLNRSGVEKRTSAASDMPPMQDPYNPYNTNRV